MWHELVPELCSTFIMQQNAQRCKALLSFSNKIPAHLDIKDSKKLGVFLGPSHSGHYFNLRYLLCMDWECEPQMRMFGGKN